MIVVEGMVGTGKSLLARSLAESMNLKLCKPFSRHSEPTAVWGVDTRPSELTGAFALRPDGVSELLQAADALGQLGQPAVLDTGMVSCLVKMGRECNADTKRLLAWWSELLGPGLRVIHLRASGAAICRRRSAEWAEDKPWSYVDRSFSLHLADVQAIRLTINTTLLTVREVHDQALSFLHAMARDGHT